MRVAAAAVMLLLLLLLVPGWAALRGMSPEKSSSELLELPETSPSVLARLEAAAVAAMVAAMVAAVAASVATVKRSIMLHGTYTDG